jgi:hypothetical protein
MRNIFRGILCTFLCLIYPLDYSLHATDWLESTVDFGVGYRLDQFNWSINDPFTGVKQVELDWKDLQILDILTSVKLTACDLIYWRINGNWGSIFLGKNHYTAFEDSPPIIISEVHNCADGHWVFDGSTGVGFHMGNRETFVQLSPMVGYSVHGQHLVITDGFKTFPEPIGPLCKLHVDYLAIWDGPWLGADLAIDTICPGLHFYGSAEYHWARYHARGCWKRRRFMIEYRDTASATGYVFVAGFNYSTTDTWAFGVMGVIEQFRTNRHGRCNRHVVNRFRDNLLPEEEFVDTLPTDCLTTLNRVNWRSSSILFTFDTYF